MDIERLLADEDRGWAELREVLARIPADRFEEPSVTPEGWSPKDVVFHVGYWLADCGRVLERIREGTFVPEEEDAVDIEAVNRDGFEVSRALDPATVRSQFEAARMHMREAFGTLPEVTTDAWEWFEESGPLHYVKHVADLRAWIDA